MNYSLITAADNSSLVSEAANRIRAEWPEFMLHDPVADYLDDCYEKLPDYQFILTDDTSGEAVAIANSIPLFWNDKIENLPDDGWDWALTKGIEDLNAGARPNILCALQIVVFGKYRGRGISRFAVEAMKKIGESNNLDGLIAPVRPSRKSDYPFVSIEDYIKRTDENGMPFDPWLRVHYRLGARIIKPCPSAMRITGTIAEWESWTGMQFPESGQYVIPCALVQVDIDRENNIGLYLEPNVWMYHPAGGS